MVVGDRLGYIAERCSIPSRIRVSKIRTVENIEHFGAELEFSSLFYGEIFEEREVDVHQTRPIKDIASRIAERVWRRRSEGGRVNATDEMAGTTVVAWTSHYIRALVGAANVRYVGCDYHVERHTLARSVTFLG